MLNAEYQAKAAREGFLDLGDAGDALRATRDYKLKGWLRDFILRYDTTKAIEEGKFGPDGSDAKSMAQALVVILGQPTGADHGLAVSVARSTLVGVMR